MERSVAELCRVMDAQIAAAEAESLLADKLVKQPVVIVAHERHQHPDGRAIIFVKTDAGEVCWIDHAEKVAYNKAAVTPAIQAWVEAELLPHRNRTALKAQMRAAALWAEKAAILREAMKNGI